MASQNMLFINRFCFRWCKDKRFFPFRKGGRIRTGVPGWRTDVKNVKKINNFLIFLFNKLLFLIFWW
jgi:hypothetical protein